MRDGVMSDHSFTKSKLTATRWKNGGGVTREIATSLASGPYWRMSIAEVERDGAFSSFPGLSRILTVITGNGMLLKSAAQTLSAQPLSPVSFDGAQNIDGTLLDGPVQNFNLIFDPKHFSAKVLVGPVTSLLDAVMPDCDIAMIYCLAGAIETTNKDWLQAHCGAFITDSTGFKAVSESESGLWIGLRQIR